VDPSDTIDQSRELARLALGFLESHAIPADPRTFTLGYAYYDGTNTELKTEVDHLIAAGAFNRRSCGRLYEDIFGVDTEARAIRDASGMIEHTLSRVLETMNEAGKDVETYGKVLEDFNGKVGNDAAALSADADIRGAIESIMAETRKMATRSSALEKRFADNSEEIVELRRDLDEMRTAATTDALTGIANRKHFDIRLLEYTEDCARNGEPLSLLMGDVDHFKTFNDGHGHQVGDMVLRLVARTMAECVRGRDFVARYGGEEFVVLLPKTGLEGSFAVAENIRNTISSKRLMLKSTGKTLGMVTLSFGVAQFKPGETLEELITRADSGLYAAKKHGRNRVESTEPLASEIRRVTMRG
jgi:diguanylate cyclase